MPSRARRWALAGIGLIAAALAVHPVRAADAAAPAAAPAVPTTRQTVFTGNRTAPPATTLVAAPGAPVGSIKHPVSWLAWGADLRLRHEFIDNLYLIDADPPGHRWNFERYRARLWATITPADAIDVNARLAWEGRYTWEPDSREGWDPSDVYWDTLNVKLRLAGGTDPAAPVAATLTVGRQDVIFGDGWLVLEGTPLDGSRSIYFDAVRLTLDLRAAKTTIDLIGVRNDSDPDSWLQAFSHRERPQIEQDERGIIAYVSNRSLPDTQLDAYFIYKHDERVLANGDDGDLYTAGGRVVRDFGPHWRARGEAAYQFGTRDNPALFPTADNNVSAWGANSRVTYSFKDGWDNKVYAGYEYLSGDDPGTGTNEQFDPLWARWPQWSELYVYTYAVETRIADVTNLHRANVGWSASPTRDLSLCANYHALFAAENPRAAQPGYSNDGYFRGHLFTGIAQYKFSRHLSAHVTGEYLLPGNYYQDTPAGPFESRRDPAAYARVEMVVTF